MEKAQAETAVNTINLLEYWDVAARRKSLIVLVTLIAFAASIAVSYLLPRKFASTTKIFPPMQEKTFGSALASSLNEGAGAVVGGLFGAKTPADVWVGILNSRTIKDAVINKFNLKESYGVNTFEEARKRLHKNIKVEKAKDEIISVTVLDGDPARAAKMADFMIEELDVINRSIVMTSGKRTRTFIEKRLLEARADLERAEAAAKAFQERNRVVRLDEQSKAVIGALGTVKGELMAKEVELQTMLTYATHGNPIVQNLRGNIDGLRAKLRELEEGGGGRGNVFIPAESMPSLALQYARLLRDVKVQETLYQLLSQQYEMARIEEAKDTPTVQVLDRADVAERHSSPKIGLIVAASTVSAFFLSVTLVFFLEYLKRMREGAA